MPKTWLKWKDCINNLSTYEWAEWKIELGNDESLPVKHVLGPCRICNGEVGVPFRNIPNPAGRKPTQPGGSSDVIIQGEDLQSEVTWLGSWNRWAFGDPKHERHWYSDHLEKRHPQRGAGEWITGADVVMRTNFVPTCDHQWRRTEVLHGAITHLREDSMVDILRTL